MKIISRIFDAGLIIYAFFYLSLFVTDYSFILKKPVSNISAPTGIFIGIIFLRFLLQRETFQSSPVIRSIACFPGAGGKKNIFCAVALTFVSFTALSLARHFSLGSSSFDLGIFDQAIWNTLHGRFFFSSLKGNINLLGDHFEPILLFFVPVYKIFPSVTVLLVTQALLLALAIVPLYLTAKHVLKEEVLAFAFIISYMLYRPLRGILLSDFHPECFTVPALFAAYYCLITKKNIGLALSVFVVLLCKEDMALIIAALGAFTCYFQRRVRLGCFLIVAGALMWIIATGVIIPYFNPKGVYPYLNRLPLGLTYADNMRAVLSNPAILGKVFFAPAKMEYCFKIFGPLGFLSLLSPPHYILFAAPLLRNLLPLNPNFSGWYNITSHYTASLVPFVYISAIYGASRILKKNGRIKLLAGSIVIFALFFYGKTDAHKFSRYIQNMREKHTLEKIAYIKNAVPPAASVAANFNLVPHLTHRVYAFEWNPRELRSFVAEYLVIDMTMLDYLSEQDKASIPHYFNNIRDCGYINIFAGSFKDLLIFHNRNFDKRKVERLGR